jgi:hypothetical protein
MNSSTRFRRRASHSNRRAGAPLNTHNDCGIGLSGSEAIADTYPKSGGVSSLSPLWLPKANADSAAILVNEFDACSF